MRATHPKVDYLNQFGACENVICKMMYSMSTFFFLQFGFFFFMEKNRTQE
jgi:hypothetical protein